MTRKHSLKDLLDREVEKPILENLYVHYGVATDQLRRAPAVLSAIAAAFNRLTSRDGDPLSTGLLLRYMLNRRKESDWPRLGRAARKFESVVDLLSDTETEALRRIYLTMDLPSDEFLFSPKFMRQLARAFETTCGRQVDASTLVAIILWHRKHRRWPPIRKAGGLGFDDIAEIA